MASEKQVVTAKTHDLAAALLSLKGRSLSFEKYKPFELVYDVDPDTMVLKAGRQIGKSVSLAGRITTKSIGQGFFNSLHVSPFQIQSKRFSNAYLDAFIESPLIKKYFKEKSNVNNVYEKSFSTGSIVYLSYAQTESDADRIRGIMADQLTVDEVQDVSLDAFVPIMEILSASEYGYKCYAGTSKSTSNTLERLWLRSNQMEWVMKCPHCRKSVIPNTFERCTKICSSPLGPSCYHCGGIIDVMKGQWAAAIPSITNNVGFHLPQFIMGANTTPKKWTGVHTKAMDALNGGLYNPATLANECFGLATDLAGKSLSPREAQNCCNNARETWYTSRAEAAAELGVYRVILGVDWSVTGAQKSFTVVSVLGINLEGRTFLLYAQKLPGGNILEQVERIRSLFVQYEADIIGCDRGVGVVQAQLLQVALGFDKVIMCNYVAAKTKLRWDNEGFMASDRTMCMDVAMQKMRRGRSLFETPSWALTEPLWEDALSIFEEETMNHRRVYRHEEDEPDDWFHSVTFGLIAQQYLTGEFVYVE